MRPLRIFVLAACALACAATARAQTAPATFIAVSAHDSADLRGVPNRVASTALELTNYTVVPVQVIPRIAVPAEWSVTVGERPFTMKSNETIKWVIGVRIPESVVPGRYVVRVSAVNEEGKQVIRDSIAVSISAPARPLVATVSPSIVSTTPTRLEVVARDSGSIGAEPGSTVTTALRITNTASASVPLTPSIAVPTDWSVPLGALPFTIGARESDSWIVSIRVPSRAAAGRYVVAVSAADAAGRTVVRDSLTVTVNASRGIELSLTNRPTYSVSGETYRASFLLQNRGNMPATIALHGASALGGIVSLDSTVVTLRAGESRTLGVDVATRVDDQEAHDDVLELRARDASDSTITAIASSRVTIVQRANTAEAFHRVASQLRVRAADRDGGVSPFELIGGGALRDGGAEQLSFVMRGPTGPGSQFGDQEEYRVELRGAHFAARGGDALYRISALSSVGQMGFGGGIDVDRGAFGAGAFTQRFRFQPNGPTERGAYVSARGENLFAKPQLTVSSVNRRGGGYEGNITGTAATFHPIENTIVELEMAASNGPSGRGSSRMARVSGGNAVHYDLGHTFGDMKFAGATRGAQHDYASVSLRPFGDWQLTATTGAHRPTGMTGGLFSPQNLRMSTLQLENASRFSLQYSSLVQKRGLGTSVYDESQRGVLARAEQTLGTARFWGAAGTGVASSGLAGSHRYHELSAGMSAGAGRSSLSLYSETSKGMSITRGLDGLVTFGGDARLQLAEKTRLTVYGFESMVLASRDRFAQIDASVSQLLSIGSTVSAHVRLNDNALSEGSRQVFFVEYAMPLQMPVGRNQAPGRVRGRVVDRETGRGVAGALVRLGPQAAITDDDGRVAFAGLAAGAYRLSLAQQTSQATSVFAGDPSIQIDSGRHAPTTFAVALERAGVVDGSVRKMIIARTGLEAAADSLADGGPLDGIMLALITTSDTLYANTSAAGTFRFAEIPTGPHLIRVVSEAPAGLKWEPAEIEVDVRAGTGSQVEFRLVPRRRAVQMIPGDTPPARK